MKTISHLSTVNVKWRGKTIDGISIDGEDTIRTLKEHLEPVTAVDSKNQKLLLKGSILKDDTIISSLNLTERDLIMMMGTATSSIPATRLLSETLDEDGEKRLNTNGEDNSTSPSGLVNLGNTCYMNSVVQFLRFSPELDHILQQDVLHQKSGDENRYKLMNSFSRLLTSLTKTHAPISPIDFLLTLRKYNPQFAETDGTGFYSQQDAQECAQAVLGAMSSLFGHSESLLPFEGELTTTIDQNGTTSVAVEKFNELSCSISQDTTNLLDGLKQGFSEIIKGENMTITKQSTISKAPKMLIVRFNRFFWKQKEQIKAKILKKVSFPLDLDLKAFTFDTAIKTSYKLRSILTHTGRSADSGHYMGWVKDKSGHWWKMDDDKVTMVKEEEVLKLDGGGDWHMAYMCLYELEDQPISNDNEDIAI